MLDKLSSNKTTDFDDGLAVGFILGRQKGKSYSSSGGDDSGTRYYYKDDPDWQWFKESPNPAPNQQIYGVRVFDPLVRNLNVTSYGVNIICAFDFNVDVGSKWSENDGFGDIDYFYGYVIEWGDGTIASHSGFNCNVVDKDEDLYRSMAQEWKQGQTHSYEMVGDYTVTITINSPIGVWKGNYIKTKPSANLNYVNNEPFVIFAKIGNNFLYNSYNIGSAEYYKYVAPYTFNYVYRQALKFLKLPSLRRFPNLSTSILNYMSGLKYLELTVDKSMYPWSDDEKYNSIFKQQFQSLPSLEKINIDLSNYTGEIPDHTFSDCHSLLVSEDIACSKLGVGAFAYCYRLRHINLLNCLQMDSSAFSSCYNLETINAPKCIEITQNSSGFTNLQGLKKISFPSITTWNCNISNLPNLVEIDLPSCTKFKGTIAYCYSLAKITVAEGCDFSEATITNCRSLGRRPDGLKYSQ